MPPASRGFFPRSPLLTFIRSYAVGTPIKIFRKTPPIKFKSSPIEGRAPEKVKRVKRPVPEEQPEQPRKPFISPNVRWFIGNVFIFAPIVTFLAMHRPYDIMSVTGGSMVPLFNGHTEQGDAAESRDKMLVRRSNHRRDGDIARGDVVVFITPHDPDKIAVKRVVAEAGDRVQPLAGYEGSEDEQENGVTIPFGHMWVEGDVDDRSKSVDSNWYGPISQNLVVGRATALLSPWYSPRWIRVSDHSWPAEEKKRVRYNAVQGEQESPDDATTREWFYDGRAGEVLKSMREDPMKSAKLAVDEGSRNRLVKLYAYVKKEVERQDPITLDVAAEVVKELEKAFYRAGGGIEYPMFPELKMVVRQEMEEAKRKEIIDKGVGVYPPSKLQKMKDDAKRSEEEAGLAKQEYMRSVKRA